MGEKEHNFVCQSVKDSFALFSCQAENYINIKGVFRPWN